MGTILRWKICDQVRKTKVFSILADESKDSSKTEQLAICLRYVDIEKASINERFLTFVPAEDLSAKGISTYILDTLQQYQLDLKFLVSQGYDGASVMSGVVSGVQTRVREVAPQAIYVHCNAHCLNLCLVASVHAVKPAREFFTLVENLYVFLSSSKLHSLFEQHQRKLYPEKPVKQLQRLSDTRWACRQSAVNALCHTFDAILATLEDISTGCDSTRAVEARGILAQVNSFQFLLCLVIFDRLLSCSKSLSDSLQAKELDLGRAGDLVSSTIETFESLRSDDEWNKLYVYCKDIADHRDLWPIEPPQPRRRRMPNRYSEDVVYETMVSAILKTTRKGIKLSCTFLLLIRFYLNLSSVSQIKVSKSCHLFKHVSLPQVIFSIMKSYNP